VVISEVFGGNSATGFRNQDFVELHNRSAQPQLLTGMSLQYGSATGTAAWQVLPLTGTIPAGGSYLVGLASTTGGTSIPTPDQVGSLNLSATAGKVALVWTSVPLTGACALSTGTLDAVGYGTTNCSELRPAPAASSTAGVVRRDLGCTDTNDNGADFTAVATEPRNSSAAPSFCTCTQPALAAPAGGAPAAGGAGVVQLTSPREPVRPSLRWSALPDDAICAMQRDLSRATIPAGMTRKDFLEKMITHVVLHEVGHTLGLRHNFKGSLEASSVMDYTTNEDAVLLAVPGTYDVAALKVLYGLSATEPTQAFCTDESTVVDAQCDRFDTSNNPLTLDIAPRFKKVMRSFLASGTEPTLGEIFRVTRYVRGPASEAQRLEAFNALLSEVAPPLRADVLALSANARAWADVYNAALLLNLFAPNPQRDAIQVDPSVQDPAFRARVIEVAKNSLLSSDGNRSLPTMRAMVDVLKALQHQDALVALNSARAALVSARASWPVDMQPLNDDLVRRIDAACSPYFR
jgi:hypothetical protein